MKKSTCRTVLLTVIILIGYNCAFGQARTIKKFGTVSQSFSKNISKIFVWIHNLNDPEYSYNTVARDAIRNKLESLGYLTEFKWYYPEDGENVVNWKKEKIESLAGEEAFMELIVNESSAEYSKTIPTETTRYVVRDSYGKPVGTVSEKGTTVRTKTKGQASAEINLYFNDPGYGMTYYNYSRSIKKAEPGIVVDHVTSFMVTKK